MSTVPRTTSPAVLRNLAAAAAVGCLLTVVTACGGSSAPPPATAAPPAAAAPGGAAKTVTVTMTEFAFSLDPPTLAPGAYTFRAVNAGKAPHAIELEGAGLDEKKSAVVQPGQSTDLAVTLQSGDLDMYCPVDGHRGKGMEMHIPVGAAGGTGAPAPSSGSGGGY